MFGQDEFLGVSRWSLLGYYMKQSFLFLFSVSLPPGLFGVLRPASAAVECMVMAIAVEHVVVAIAVEHVIVAAAIEHIVAATAIEHIVAATAIEHVIAATAVKCMVAAADVVNTEQVAAAIGLVGTACVTACWCC